MQDIIAAIVSFFLIQPIEAEMAERLAAGKAPIELVQSVTECIGDAAPGLVQRVSDDPLWALGSVAGIWVGATMPEDVLVDAAPGCASAVMAVQPFLDAGAA